MKILVFSVALFLHLSVQDFGLQGLNAQEIVKQGSWSKVLYTVKGSWQIVKAGSKLQIVLDEDFSTTNAPDLNILLSPQEASKINSSNVMNKVKKVGLLEGKVSWGKLKGPITLDLDPSIDLSKYKSIVLHCINYSKIWAVAKL